VSNHTPVLLKEVIAGLDVRPGGRYIDATIGAGGHAAAILERSAPDGQLLGIDVDPLAIETARQNLKSLGERVTLYQGNFRTLRAIAQGAGFVGADGILFDLGLSSLQLADESRGFGFGVDAPLDMRMSPELTRTAADMVNQLSAEELEKILKEYGQERWAKKIAMTIVLNRRISTSKQLAELIARVIPRRGRLHPATKTFQALRVAVNDELGAIAEALPQALELLKPKGRLGVISFHSLEDRLVKNFFRRESRGCICPPELLVCECGHEPRLKLLSAKAIKPTREEVAANPRARSARLRLGIKL